MGEIDKDGYEVIPAMPAPSKGFNCGLCGMKFEHGKAYGYVCGRQRCPMALGSPSCSAGGGNG